MMRVDSWNRITWSLLVAACVGWAPAGSQACTLFAAAGETVRGGGVLIAKNRDWRPDHVQSLRSVSPMAGYRYFGLFADGNDEPGLKAGVNEKGLVVVSATSSIPPKLRAAMPRTRNLLSKLLATSASVEEAMHHAEWFVGPRYLLLADREKAASIEVGRNGQFGVAVTDRSILVHTNHYVFPEGRNENPARTGASSLARYRRAEELLDRDQQFTLADFIRISNDRSGTPDRSLWRDGSTPTGTRTLAAWIVYLPPAGDFQLYVRIVNPGQEPTVSRLSFKEIFD
jgi:isopenicillin-N N-acyltransferase like protein